MTRSSATPPVPPAADRKAKPDESGNKKPDVRREAPAPAADDLDLTFVDHAVEPVRGVVGQRRARYHPICCRRSQAGRRQSAPSTDGLKWLADKGYRTILDLRESSEVPPSFIAQVTVPGWVLRYVRVADRSPNTIDRDHVDRFNFEMAAGEARPLFFFDTDGTRAGALWYIRRIANDRVDRQIARREAQELGLTDSSYWGAATNYIDRMGTPQTTATSRPTAQGATEPGMSLNGASNGQKPGESRDNSGLGSASAKPPQSSSSSDKTGPDGAAQVGASGNAPIQQAVAPPSPPTAGGLPDSLAWAPIRRHGAHGFVPPNRLLDPYPPSRHPGESSGQSRGTGAATEITSARVGCVNVNCPACSAIRKWPSTALNGLCAPYFRSPTMGRPRLASWTRSW